MDSGITKRHWLPMSISVSRREETRRIGRGIALKLAENGVNVGVHYYRNESAAKDTLEEVRKRGSDGFLAIVPKIGTSRQLPVNREFLSARPAFEEIKVATHIRR